MHRSDGEEFNVASVAGKRVNMDDVIDLAEYCTGQRVTCKHSLPPSLFTPLP